MIAALFAQPLDHGVRFLTRFRWLASIILILMLDVCTWFAFKESSGGLSFPYADKVIHALAFCGLTIVGHVSLNFDFFPRISRFSWALTLFNVSLWMGYGLFIEAVHKLLSYRASSLGDLVADGVGILLGVIFVTLFKLYPGSPTRDQD